MTYFWDRVPMLERDRHLHKINLSSIKALKTIKWFCENILPMLLGEIETLVFYFYISFTFSSIKS